MNTTKKGVKAGKKTNKAGINAHKKNGQKKPKLWEDAAAIFNGKQYSIDKGKIRAL
jgi:hypothetical protein